ncbi:CAMK family protein kinase [Histomonas meleagridis]|uniref:CAMK family protein kinase n=1 Tax=Histomonas meleagridis TaxID=135588 RepID=UPI003559F4A4|nr:CAMK family protein kinase [Histomonas meleagridis]KAH0803553.1 CAMK family protein kinase [Histomonas meleagridis]
MNVVNIRSHSLGNYIFASSEIVTTYGERKYIKKINQYKLLNEIGKGAYSKVFLAINTENSKLYAVKRIRIRQLAKTAIGVSLIQREIGMMSKLNHKNIVGLHEVIFVKDNQSVYLVMDYADCGNLTKHHFKPNEIRYIFSQIVEGVSYLHKNGIVHQDIKPQNILLNHDGTALITDFGIGHSFESCARVVGTPAYQAPEVIDRSPNDQDYEPGKEDIWSLGVTLYTLTFGTLPYQGQTVFEIVRSIVTTELTPPRGSDPLLWDLVTHMLKPEAMIGITLMMSEIIHMLLARNVRECN